MPPKRIRDETPVEKLQSKRPRRSPEDILRRLPDRFPDPTNPVAVEWNSTLNLVRTQRPARTNIAAIARRNNRIMWLRQQLKNLESTEETTIYETQGPPRPPGPPPPGAPGAGTANIIPFV